MNIKIKHLYPNLLNLYGDKGNIASLKMRCLWRGIGVETEEITNNDFSLDDCDLLILGGGYEREQNLVLKELSPRREDIKNYIESNGIMLALCGGYEMLGSFKNSNEGLKILDIETDLKTQRLMGDILLECAIDGEEFTVAGFENHSGRVDIKNYSCFGKVIAGHGNDGSSGIEGVSYKNLFATHLHGPLLPKNPVLTDIIISRVLKNKYPHFENLEPLDDNFEHEAHQNIVLKFEKE